MTAQLSFELVQRQTAKKGLVIKDGKSSGAQVVKTVIKSYMKFIYLV
ncbi:unnamed protein product [Staurois parvus]|uniref:Uncharacterized protein n=1 Tax=Staurois parvus TaxID=386267 RepID=A0ABN9E947_9NEOB|nr:unnamed protein product [Staurois parvus]